MDTDNPKELPNAEAADEDVPSDFFDEFNKDEFMEGLSVIDSWGDEAGKRHAPRIDAEAVESVKDLRELIRDGKEVDDRAAMSSGKGRRRSASQSRLDDYIKPGSRRDPNKTNEAIRRDKEVKVKEYLAKHLESTDDLRPPGTELDDFFEENKSKDVKESLKVTTIDELEQPPSKEHKYSSDRRRSLKHSPVWQQASPQPSPRRSPRTFHSRGSPRPWHQRRHSPRNRYSPRRHSPLRHSPPRHSPSRFSGSHRVRTNRLRSPIRLSPLRRRRDNRSPQDRRSRNWSPVRYRSPEKRSRNRSPLDRRSRTRSPLDRRLRDRSSMNRYSRSRSRDRQPTYGYPPEPNSRPATNFSPIEAYQGGPGPVYPGPLAGEFPGPGPMPQFPYGQGPGFNVPGPYSFVRPEIPPVPGPAFNPQPVPAPIMNPMPVPMPMAPRPQAPSMVPPPQTMGMVPQHLSPANTYKKNETQKPYDALAQLVAEGKLSKEDYLKLAPNKGKSAILLGASTSLDNKARVDVLNRCNEALSKLSTLRVPNRLLMNTSMLGAEPKMLTAKFCSPLKRQPPVEFAFTRASSSTATLHNKQLVDSIIAAIGLGKVLARPKKKANNTRDAAVQTSKPYCDVCEIRDSRECFDASTCIMPEELSASVHTQVLEEDLMSSRAMFNPTGSMADGGPMSIAHMTPAQLVSQLAARAKTLKQTDPPPPLGPPPHNQYSRRPNYDYDRGGQFSNNNYNNYNRY